MSFLLSLLRPVAYASVPILCLQYSPRGRYFTRRAAYVGALGFVATLAAFVAAGMSVIGQRYNVNFTIARTFYFVAGNLLGIRVEVEGEEWLRDATEGGGMPALLMANHQSMLDILPVGRVFPKRTSMTSKKSLQFSPLGPFMTMSGAVFIDRGNSAKALRSLDDAVKVMREKRVSLWMFPEGTRHSTEAPTMLPFKKGGFHLAIQAGIPIIPIVFENYWRLYHKDVFESGVMRVKVLPPVPTTGLTSADIPDLVARVREQMVKALIDISVKVPSSSSATIEPSAEAAEKAATIPDAVVDVATAPKDFSPTVPIVPSHDSLASATSTRSTETELETDDDDMVLVGRPT
ncbi:1-acylglycerol-3-phosphate o-acyltransferase [Mycena kentingensis (nom. inval.)]|nr:1-acylglycerol-3-phosphate o-acyltransferase [Mycena kentingensis (nom. inval.)]